MHADLADNHVLEAAADGDAEVIVGADRHPRRLGVWRAARIPEPATLREELS